MLGFRPVAANPSPQMRPDNVPAGIVLVLVTLFLFALMNAIVKVLADDYPLNQIVFFRSAFALVPGDPRGVPPRAGGTAHPPPD